MRECGEIMGVTGELSEDSPASTGPMGILDHVFKRLIRFKMLNQVWNLATTIGTVSNAGEKMHSAISVFETFFSSLLCGK